MKRSTSLLIVPVLFVIQTVLIYPVHADLVDRGGGLIYDTEQDITFLQDANYAKTSNYDGADDDGRMQWIDAVEWAENLVYQGYYDWRLPKALNNRGNPCTGDDCLDTEMLIYSLMKE